MDKDLGYDYAVLYETTTETYVNTWLCKCMAHTIIGREDLSSQSLPQVNPERIG